MHPILLKAVQKAKEHIELHLEPAQNMEETLRKQLKRLDKATLIDLIVAESKPKASKAKLETLVYAILTDKDCAWLTWDTLAALITGSVPGTKTTATSLQWYPSHAAEGITIIPRKPTKDIAKLLMPTLTEGDHNA
jgi:hypothetical protein